MISSSRGSPPWIGRLAGSQSCVAVLPWSHVDDEQILAGIVDGEVLVGLEEAQLAHRLGADPAGGEVGHTAGGEFQANVGDVDLGG